MTAVSMPDLDLSRLRSAVDRLDLSAVDLPHLDLDLDSARRDLARFRSAVEDIDLPVIDLPDLDQLLGRSRQRSLVPSGSLLVGGLALLGGLALGGLVAYFLNPAKGTKRRRAVRRRLGRLKRRVLG